MDALKNWVRQPTTIVGMGTAVATIAHLIAQALAHQVDWATAVGGIAFAVVALAIPDNTAAAADTRKAATDALTAIATRRLAEMAPVLFADAAAIVKDATATVPASASSQ